jgi:hypothetical protein
LTLKALTTDGGMNRRLDQPIGDQNHHDNPTAYVGPAPGKTIEYPDEGIIIVELDGQVTLVALPEGMRL